MHITVVPVTPFQQNCSILVCDKTHRAAIVDPGGEVDRLTATLEKLDATLEKILLTHAHLDHVGGTRALADRLQVPIEGPHREDLFWLEAMPQQAAMFGFPDATPFEPQRWLEGGDSVHFGEQTLEVRHCPGHTPGHVIFFHAQQRVAIVGDVLFRGSIGRTDFPRGDHATLLRSIETQLMPLGEDVTILPGHGPTSTLGEERRSNPYLTGPR